MAKTKTVAVSVLVIVAAASVTLVAQSRQEQQMSAELRIVQEQQQHLALAIAQLAESVKALNPRFDEVNENTRKRMADLEQTIKNMSGDVSAVRAQAQDTGTRLGRMSDELDALVKAVASLQGEVLRLASQAPVAPLDPNAPPPVSLDGAPLPPAPQPPPLVVVGSPNKQLETAKGDHYAGQHAAAITGFEAVIRNFPGGQSAAEAQHLIGESYALQSRWPDAIAAYNLVIQNYPKTSFVPSAYYKRGVAEERMGRLEEARATFESAMKMFSGTTEGQMAKQGFDRVSRLVAAKPR